MSCRLEDQHPEPWPQTGQAQRSRLAKMHSYHCFNYYFLVVAGTVPSAARYHFI